MTIYSLEVLLSQFGTSLLFHFPLLLDHIHVYQEAGKVVWYSHLFKNFTQFVVIHTDKCFSVVNEAKVDAFLEFSCFFYDPTDVVSLISGSSAFSKSKFNIWKFLVHILLTPSLENFEHHFAGMWNERNYAVIWTFFGIAFLWNWNENWPSKLLLYTKNNVSLQYYISTYSDLLWNLEFITKLALNNWKHKASVVFYQDWNNMLMRIGNVLFVFGYVGS